MRPIWLVHVCLVTLVSCAESARENLVDPVVVPTIEMSAPVLDGGSVLIEWRYLSEGSDLSAFSIRRTVSGETAEIGRVDATLTTGSDWQTASIRDSVLVAGIDVTYRVVAILSTGVESATASNSLRLEGTKVDILIHEAATVAVQVRWSDPPPGATGFELRRSSDDGTSETIFKTDDVSVREYDDADLAGNTLYSYEVVTRIGETEISSAPVEAARYLLESSWPHRPAGRGSQRAIMFQNNTNFTNNNMIFLATEDDSGVRLVWHQRVVDPDIQSTPFDLGFEYAQGSLSIKGALDRHQDLGTLWYAAGINPSNQTITFAAYYLVLAESVAPAFATAVLDTLLTWPSSGGTSTGMGLFGERIILYEGSTLRVLDKGLVTGFEVLEESAIDMGEPIDIDYVDGSLWLAYPDALYKSNPTSTLSGISWERLPVPDDLHITAFARIEKHTGDPGDTGGSLVILDGLNGRLHLVDANGGILLSWDALGTNLESGDIAPTGTLLLQADGSGDIYFFDPGIPQRVTSL